MAKMTTKDKLELAKKSITEAITECLPFIKQDENGNTELPFNDVFKLYSKKMASYGLDPFDKGMLFEAFKLVKTGKH